MRAAVLCLAVATAVSAAMAAPARGAVEDADRLGAAEAAPDVRSMTFDSQALRRPMPYSVYLPPGYERSAKRYPVLYMLHGMGGSRDEWRTYGLIDVADRMIRARQIAPLVIVMPQGDRGYWMDHADGGREAWGTYLVRDVVSEVDARFRTIPERGQRAIGGVSMGAHGAVQLALNHPDTFFAVGAHSLVLRRFEQAFPFFGDRLEYAKRDPMTLVGTAPDVAGSLALWIDIGDRDPWAATADQFHSQLARLGIEHEWHRWPGDHSATYWRTNVADYVRFYDAAMRRSWRAARPGAGALIQP